jgi:hypothetical protein
MNFRMVFSFGCSIDRKGPTLARIEQHAFKRKCPLALNSIANKYWSNRESNDYLSLVRTDLANGSNKRSPAKTHELDRDAPFSMRDEGCIVVSNQLREGFSP